MKGDLKMRLFKNVLAASLLAFSFTATAQMEGDYTFVPHEGPKVVEDMNGSAYSELVALGKDQDTGQPLISIKDSKTGDFIKYIPVLDSSWTVMGLDSLEDLNYDTFKEIGVRASNQTLQESRMITIDPRTGLVFSSVSFASVVGGEPPPADPPASNNAGSLALSSASSQYAYISDSAQTGLDIAGDFTFEAWVKSNNLSGIQRIIAKINGVGYSFYSDSGKLRSRSWNSSGLGYGYVTSDIILFSNTWNHIAVTNEILTKTMVIYINGSSVTLIKDLDEGGSGTNIGDSTANFVIGAFSTPLQYFDGQLDDVRVWNVVRTQVEIQSDMNTGCSPSTTAGLMTCQDFEGDLLDKSANGNNLTPVNAPAFSTDVPY